MVFALAGDSTMTRRRSATGAHFCVDDRILPAWKPLSAGCAGHHSDAQRRRKWRKRAILAPAMPANPRPSWPYLVVGALSYPFLRIVFRYRSRGLERVPAEGGYVLAANHLSNADPWPLGMGLFPRRYLRFMAKAELFWFPLGPFIAACGAFPVRRDESDTGGGRDGGRAVPRRARRRHVPRGHAAGEGAEEEAHRPLALRRGPHRPRGGRSARPGRDRGHRRAPPVRGAARRLRGADRAGRPRLDVARGGRTRRDRPAQRRDHELEGSLS